MLNDNINCDILSPVLLDVVTELAESAGEAILQIYNTDFAVESKSDKSPLTQADLASHRIIEAGLKYITPEVPVLSEESAEIPYEERKKWRCYWLIDPLDGTKEFVKRNGEFTVNIALIRDHKPILGIVYVPVEDIVYRASIHEGASKRLKNEGFIKIHTRLCPDNHITVVGSRSHSSPILNEFLSALNTEFELISIGSSLKICLVAEGKADIYPRFGLTSEWDTAAAQCVLEQARGRLTDTALEPLFYNKKDSILNPHFLAFGDKTKEWARYLKKSA